MTERTSTTRRRFLAGAAVTGAAGLAGCGALSEGGDPEGKLYQPDASESTVTPDEDGLLPTPVLGDPDADVTVMVFEDYVCGHCASYVVEHFPDLGEEYIQPGTIRYEHHEFPLPLSEESWRAPNAARAVQDTAGSAAYWEYSQRLYRNQSDLGPDLYESLAEDVGADPGLVRSAAVDEQYSETIQADKQFGDSLGVEATPTVFVNDTALDSYDFETISQAIDDAL
ncbi:DsbA family protein [Halapricum hydrolyticum]|uniref:DsbA family protein n=1 Tax=Halapricum hydrolyticum TaxID=2979991 RepID=A0AAE3LGW3_9EURY|nr:thioredoxin domain-containing protein [Halapricum hydrolyticum]MCU4717312.1 DsbA family protein [Halapricum hydrolyticum]MCU4726239.1 DsbA family protein [Halapricum hydrolyticum]